MNPTMFKFADKKDITYLDSNLNEILSKMERLEEIHKIDSINQAKLEAIDNQLIFKENYEKLSHKYCELLRDHNQLKLDFTDLYGNYEKTSNEVNRLRKSLIHKEKLIRELKKREIRQI